MVSAVLCKGTWAADSAVTSELGATASLQWESVLHAQHCGLHKSCWLGATEHAKSKSCLQGYRYRHWHKLEALQVSLSCYGQHVQVQNWTKDAGPLLHLHQHIRALHLQTVLACAQDDVVMCVWKTICLGCVCTGQPWLTITWPLCQVNIWLSFKAGWEPDPEMQILGIMSRFRLWNAYCPEWKKITKAAR